MADDQSEVIKQINDNSEILDSPDLPSFHRGLNESTPILMISKPSP